MTITTLDPATALVVVDLQQGLAGYPTTPSVAEVTDRAGRLARAFRERGLPVVLVNVAGRAPGRADVTPGGLKPDAGWTDFLPALDPQPEDHVVTKRTWGAFTGTDLADWLQGRGATQVVVCGVATSAGVESTVRQAHELGFNVTVAADAMADMAPEAHENSIARIFPKIAEVGTVAEILGKLGRTVA